jgi:hypothetical protein
MVKLLDLLLERQLPSGGWSFGDSRQAATEPTCLATLAISNDQMREKERATALLIRSQRADGGWPTVEGDTESSWITALILSTAIVTNSMSTTTDAAFQWLLREKGRESHWLWRWKFKTTDRMVRFDPDKYGWSWTHGTGSWVIPTAFSVIAIKQYTVCARTEESERRVRIGVEMLYDRACIDGGWNSGNSVVYGFPLQPHVEATAIALLALQDERRNEVVEKSLRWLRQQTTTAQSASSLAWTILSLFTYKESIRQLQDRLSQMIGERAKIQNNATLAAVILALRCGEMIHPFMVLR